MDTPIVYPKITIPGKGTFSVKFSLGATIRLEQMGVSNENITANLRAWQTIKGDDGAIIQQGKASPLFLVRVLSACIAHEIILSPSELGDCFEPTDLVDVARVVAEAFSKIRPPRQVTLREVAAKQPEQAPPS